MSSKLEYRIYNNPQVVQKILKHINVLSKDSEVLLVLSEDIANKIYYDEFNRVVSTASSINTSTLNLLKKEYILYSIKINVELAYNDGKYNNSKYDDIVKGYIKKLRMDFHKDTEIIKIIKESLQEVAPDIKIVESYNDEIVRNNKNNIDKLMFNTYFVIRGHMDNGLKTDVAICCIVSEGNNQHYIPICRLVVNYNNKKGHNNNKGGIIGINNQHIIQINGFNVYALHSNIQYQFKELRNEHRNIQYDIKKIKQLINISIIADLYLCDLEQIQQSISQVKKLCMYILGVTTSERHFSQIRAVVVVGHCISIYLRRRKSILSELVNLIIYKTLPLLYQLGQLEVTVEKPNIESSYNITPNNFNDYDKYFIELIEMINTVLITEFV